MRKTAIVPIEELKQEPYSSLICYPRVTDAELHSRIAELTSLYVEAVEFSGKGSAFNVPILGKGYVGIVAMAHVKGERVALKIRRVDADRSSLRHEAEMLAKANAVQVGPKLISHSKDFLLMQLIEGDLLPVWLETHREKEVLRSVLANILEQTWRLDQVDLDHGELSKAPKHLTVDGKRWPWILDFETASDVRKPANVTAVCQYLFVGGSPVALAVGDVIGERDRSAITEALRLYKKERTRENFERVRQVCQLTF
jgi:putative serine/threonine protein kinase